MTATEGPGRVDLTDAEWMSLIALGRDGLPACCADVSDLRDDIIMLARANGEVYGSTARMFLEQYDHAAGCGDLDGISPALDKLVTQIRAILAAEKPPPERKPEPPKQRETMPARDHVHDFDRGPMPPPCPEGLACTRYPRQTHLEAVGGTVVTRRTFTNLSDMIADGLLEARSTLSLLSGFRPREVPFHANIERGLDGLTVSIALLHPMLWPEDHRPARSGEGGG